MFIRVYVILIKNRGFDANTPHLKNPQMIIEIRHLVCYPSVMLSTTML